MRCNSFVFVQLLIAPFLCKHEFPPVWDRRWNKDEVVVEFMLKNCSLLPR